MILPETKDYCAYSGFNVTCGPHEVILMREARYGRMRSGTCGMTSHRVGCSDDITADMDKWCSGKQSCHVVIPIAELARGQSCPIDLMSYLEAAYDCVKCKYCWITCHLAHPSRKTIKNLFFGE